jgi:hypothetical protein
MNSDIKVFDKAVEINIRIDGINGDRFYLEITKEQAIKAFKQGMILTYNEFDMAYLHNYHIPHAKNISYA